MKLSNQQKNILKKIENNPVKLNDLYSFYTYSSNLFAGLKSLENKKLVKKEKDNIIITESGKKYIRLYIL